MYETSENIYTYKCSRLMSHPTFSLIKQQQVDPGEREKTNFDAQALHDVKEACFANNYPVQAHKNSKIYVSIFFYK